MIDYNPINNKHNLFVKTSVDDEPVTVHFWGPWAQLLQNTSRKFKEMAARHVYKQVVKK